ncbi:heterokaryon incompatibility protein-domain-containing protein [Clohesyomyces aquaticus]|uniref:Heterokaryon incompatibility protein-domain-containing protein n=1 Tax=Clohesyomyces aquaticus TaxID=1231657 RepID=A0A1Y1ZYI6_9PLEO|nr:heterokaryon incompatibility protein-domain-containing protein [Clohesyomyces aquaticus]
MFCIRCQAFWQDVISNAKIPGVISSRAAIGWPHYEVVLHRSLGELKSSSEQGCPICRAIWYSPTTYERDALLSDDDEKLDVMLCLDPAQGPHPVLSSWILEFNGNGEQTVRLPKRMIAGYGGLLEDEELALTLKQCEQLDNRSTGSNAALQLASFWLHRCLSAHPHCCMPNAGRSTPFVPTRLLDVDGGIVCLVETKEFDEQTRDRRYLALSHCWGKIPIITTCRENFNHHLSEIPFANLSRTFQDAVTATRKLGFRYIWIDSLCIIQGDTADWEVEAATMSDVYRNATLTIVAAHAAGGAVGCFEERDGLLQFPFLVDVPHRAANTPIPQQAARILFTCYGRSKGLGDAEPPLYGRAWVLQEQLLSPRMLIFDGPQLRWECLEMHGSECSPIGGLSRQTGYMKAIRSGIMNDADFFDLPTIDDPVFAAKIQHQYWCFAVMDYTHRGMTQLPDRLIALEGIGQALAAKTKDRYLAGLWLNHFFIGLLWSIPYEREFTTTTPDAFDIEANKTVRQTESLGPSWSWASVTVPVVYQVPAIISVHRICHVVSSQVSGIPSKRTGWVKIKGHIRKGYINAIYPYAIREAAARVPHMVYPKPTSSLHRITFRGRAFFPSDFFLFSMRAPNSSEHAFSVSSDWHLVRGTFRPDEVIDPSTPITFLAIAQQNTGDKKGSLLHTHGDTDPLQVYSLALVPTQNRSGEYRRVGYAVWEDCAWYGHMCGQRNRLGRNIEQANDGLRSVFSGLSRNLEKMSWSNGVNVDGKGAHERFHSFQPDQLPDMKAYHKHVGIEEEEIIIV